MPITQSFLKENGTITAYASTRTPEPVFPYYPLMRANVNIRLVYVYTMPDETKRQACTDIVQAIEDGRLTHAVAARFPLNDIAGAHELVESGDYMGNVVLNIG